MLRFLELKKLKAKISECHINTSEAQNLVDSEEREDREHEKGNKQGD